MAVIEIENLTRDYGQGRGIFDLSFEVQAGEAFGFLGPNGAGKTTTIRHLMGFIRPKQGRVTINGFDCWNDRVKIQAAVGYIPGEIAFFNDMTGAEYLRFLAKYRGTGNAKQAVLTERFELDDSSLIKKMSKGTKQKLGIVAAFMHDPEILILDEPSSGLDPLMQNRFIEWIEEEKKQEKTILMSSHMFEEVERTCHRIGIIRKGRLVALDLASSLQEKHVRTYTVTLEDEASAARFAADFDGQQDGLQVKVKSKQSLERIFLDYYEEVPRD